VRWAALALLGIVLAAAASYGASELANQPIGLSSEPITAGDQLAPRRTPAPKPKATRTPRPKRTPTPTPIPTVDDDSSGHGSGGDDGGDDD
jgi:hypothetical protein